MFYHPCHQSFKGNFVAQSSVSLLFECKTCGSKILSPANTFSLFHLDRLSEVEEIYKGKGEVIPVFN
jgi:hypothetical protein